jgi:hypothetical protein
VSRSTIAAAALAISVFACAIALPARAEEQNASCRNEHDGERQPPAPLRETLAEVKPDAPQQRPKDQPAWRKAFAPETWPGWAVVVVAIAASWIAIATLRAIRCQAAANVIAANAAKVSADAVMQSQRAWLVPEKWLSADEDQQVQSLKPYPGLTPDQQSATFIPIRNIGKTPAFETKVMASPSLFKVDSSGHTDILDTISTGRRVLGRGSRRNYMLSFSVGGQETVDAIESGAVLLTVKVRITYGDPLKTSGETEFTMRYHPGHPGFFSLSGTFGSGGDAVMR